jgi:hypothetical protein
MSNAKNDHGQTLHSILNGESLKKAKVTVPPAATPSGSPNTKETGVTSLGKAKANYTPPPDTNIIPIFPMRYAIKGDSLISLMESPKPFISDGTPSKEQVVAEHKTKKGNYHRDYNVLVPEWD